MTVLSCRELSLIRGSATYAEDGSTAQRMFHIMLAERPITGEDFDTIAALDLFPAIGSRYKDGDRRRCKKKAVNGSSNTDREFVIVCDFEVPEIDGEYEPDPLKRPDQISFDGNSGNEPYFTDSNDNPVVTSAGFPFEQQRTRTTGSFGLTIRGNRAEVAPSTYALYLRPNSINANEFTVRSVNVGAEEAKLTSIRFTREVEGQHAFWALEWVLASAPTWADIVEDRGYYYKDGSDTKPILTGDPPELVGRPWPLNGAGGKRTTAIEAPAPLVFYPYPKRDFAIFNWTVA